MDKKATISIENFNVPVSEVERKGIIKYKEIENLNIINQHLQNEIFNN